MTFLDFFAGIGGFRMGMELAGHECIGFCEFDKYAVASYTSMHLITEDQRKHLATLDFRKRQIEILKEEYRNGEWYSSDINGLDARSLPKADCWCFGFPCQDISCSGNQIGIQGSRSSLFFRVMYLLGRQPEEEKPTFLFIENVKNLFSVNRGWDFARLLIELDRGGYDAEWQILNSKEFGVPQSRERIFIIGHFRGRSTAEVFPVTGSNEQNRVRQIGMDGTSKRKNPNQYRVYDVNGLSPTLNKMDGGGREPHIEMSAMRGRNKTNDGYTQTIEINPERISNSLTTATKDNLVIETTNNDRKIRRLTPKECFRLQGWPDEYFEKAQFVNSDSQLYKQAGNGVTVTVIKAIAEKMKEQT